MQLAGCPRVAVAARVLELLGRHVEDRALVVDLGRREVERVAQAGVDREARGRAPVVLDEELQDPGPLPELLVLKVDREVLHLAQEEAREGQARAGGAGPVAALAGESEQPRGRRRLDDVEPLQPKVGAGLQRVTTPLQGERVHELRHVRRGVGVGVGGRPELLEAVDREGRKRVLVGGVRGDAGQPQSRGRRSVEDEPRAVQRAARVAQSQVVDHPWTERVHVAQDRRLRARVRAPDRACRQAAAAVGEGRHRVGQVLEVAEAGEQLVAVRGVVVGPHVELVLVVALVREAPVVVGRPGQVGEWIAAQQLRRHRVDPACWDGAGRERIACGAAARGGACRRRIVDRRHATGDRFREDSSALQGRGDGRDAHASDALPAALVVHEEERPVLRDRPAQDEAELVAAEVRFVGVVRDGGREEVPRVQRLVAQELECRAVELIAPRPGGQVDDAAVEAPELGRRRAGDDLELLDRVDDREVRDRTGLRLQDRDAVVEILVDARPPAVEARKRRTRRQRHAGYQGHERQVAPAVQR